MYYAALALLLGGASPAPADALANLDFRAGNLSGWEGEGFYVTTLGKTGPSLTPAVCSSDNGKSGRNASSSPRLPPFPTAPITVRSAPRITWA